MHKNEPRHSGIEPRRVLWALTLTNGRRRDHMLPLDAFDLSPAEVQRRFAWAVRQGNRNWLWPGIPIASWRVVLLQMERVTREILLNGSAATAFTGSAECLGVAAFTSGMGPLLGYWGAEGRLRASAEVLALLDLHYRHNAIRMDLLARHANEAVEALDCGGIRATILKGMQTAFEYFPTPGTRPLSDIDLLVDTQDREVAGQVLRQLGYLPGKTVKFPPQQCWRMATSPPWPRSLVLTHRDGPWYIDLHTGLNQRYSAGAGVVELDPLRESGVLESWALSGSADALSPTAMLLHLACHASCGLESLTMVRLTELVLVIRKGASDGRFSWNDFLALAEETMALPNAYPALRLTEQLCPGTVPEAVLRRAELQIPAAVRRVVGRLRPASAQRVIRCSLEERFMWTTSLPRLLRQLALEVLPTHVSLSELLWIYKMRWWRLVRGTLRRKAPEAF